jgi:hypothetical protein
MNAKLLSFASLIVLACGPGGELPPCGNSHVVASLSAVTLANDCGSNKAAPAGVADVAGACAEGYACPSLCRQSSMQLSFVSTSQVAAKIEIRAVRLLDKNTRALLQTLTSREPQQWSADKYLAWDETVPAGVTLQTAYKLSAPSYNYAADARLSYQPYLVEVDVAIDGNVQTLQAEATREPEVAT